jgi:hypothetical protein
MEERGLRRLLRALHDPRGRSGLTAAFRRNVGLPADHPAVVALAEAVDNTGAALDSLADQLRRFVHSQTVVGEEELRRYGVRVRLEAAALSAAGGPALRTATESLQAQFRLLAAALGQVVSEVGAAIESGNIPAGRRPLRALRLARSLARDLQQVEQHYRWFWSFAEPTRTVRMVELSRADEPLTPNPMELSKGRDKRSSLV